MTPYLESTPNEISAVIFPDRKKVACVLLQAAFGGDRRICNLFSTEAWETSDPKGAKAVRGTREQWKKLGLEWSEHHKNERKIKLVK